MIRAAMPSSRSAMPSSTSATPRLEAPASSAATDTSSAPWPYPFALTTAHSAAGDATLRSSRTLCRMASRSTSATVGRNGLRDSA